MAEKTTHFPTIEEVPSLSWKKLSEKKICFGHQSVGYNIIEGIKELMKENPQIRLNIVEKCGFGGSSSPPELKKPIFFPFWVGKNTDPRSKIEAFAGFMEKVSVNSRPDVAFFKFCYVDVTARTDIQKIFSDYKNTMSRMKKSFPKTTFVHVTVPLTSKPIGIKAWIKKSKDIVKKIIGRPVFHYHDNINRNRFNEMLRKEYYGKAPIFDLAKIQSTTPDARSTSFTKKGKTYYTLAPNYTYDGGHLNELGRKKAAEQLLILLASLCQ